MTSNPKPSFLSRQSTAKIGLVALGLIALAVAIAVYPTIQFGRAMSVEGLQPVATFESGETFEFIDPDPYSGYRLTMSVNERNSPLPPMEVSVSNADGEVEGTPIDMWSSVMGREYKHFLKLPPQPDGKLSISIDTPENENFLIFRKISDVVSEARARALPLWITSLIPLGAAIFCLGIILVRAVNASSKIEMHVSS